MQIILQLQLFHQTRGRGKIRKIQASKRTQTAETVVKSVSLDREEKKQFLSRSIQNIPAAHKEFEKTLQSWPEQAFAV
jgi:hypothetical protein